MHKLRRPPGFSSNRDCTAHSMEGSFFAADFPLPSPKFQTLPAYRRIGATLAELTGRIPEDEWKKCSWVMAGRQTRRTHLAWHEVFLQHDLRHAGGELEKVWLVVDWPAGDPEPYHYYLAHLHRPPTKARCLKLSRSRWHIEQYFQRSKDDLGLDHFEGRSWRGFHHHLVLSAVAYLFILTVYLRRKKNFWCDVGTDSPHDPALAGEIERTLSLLRNEVQANLQRHDLT